MKVVAINGSARKGGIRQFYLAIPCANLKKKASKPNWWNSAAPKSTAASPAASVRRRRNRRCSQKTTWGTCVSRRWTRRTGYCWARPTYVADVSSEIKAVDGPGLSGVQSERRHVSA